MKFEFLVPIRVLFFIGDFMRLKPNYLLQFSIWLSITFILIAPGMLIMLLFLNVKIGMIELLNGLSMIVMTIVGTFIVNSIINFLITLFIKPQLILYDETFVYKNKTYKYTDIIALEYDLGTISKVSSKSDAFVLYRKSESGIIIKNPSIKMMAEIKRRCSNKPFRIENYKQFLIVGAISTIIGLLYGILNK